MGSVGSEKIRFIRVFENELGVISDLSRTIWQDYFVPQILTEGELEGFWSRSYAPDKLRENVLQGAIYEWIVLGAERIGFLSFKPEYDNRRLHLGKLYLLPCHHGRGFGAMALAHIRAVARNLDLPEIYLYVFRKNEKAIRAYQRAGFTVDRLEVTQCEGGLVYDDVVMICREMTRGARTIGADVL